MSSKKASPVDAEVGVRIRFYRLNAGMSQTQLGEKIGVTFQQVQKYENGSNRVGAGRLTQIAHAVGVPVTAFFEAGGDAAEQNGHPSVTELLSHPSAIRMLQAYSSIPDSGTQFAIVRLMEALGSEQPRKDSK
jgi:transcriptional regulator with XRE-family HTH domain